MQCCSQARLQGRTELLQTLQLYLFTPQCSAVVQWAAPARTTTPDTERVYLRNKEQLDILLERHESQIDIPL